MSDPIDTLTALGDGGAATRVLSGDCTVIYDGDRREEHRGHVTVLVKPDNTVLVHDAEGYQPVAWLTRADAVSCTRGARAERATTERSELRDAQRSGAAGRTCAGSGDVPAAGHESPVSADGAARAHGEATTPADADGATADDRGRATTGDRDGPPTRDGSTACDGASAFSVDAQDGDAHLRVRAHVEDGYAAYPATRAGRPVGECPDCSGTLVRAGRAVTCIGCGSEHGLPDGATVRDERCDCGHPRIRVERGAPLDVCLDRSCEPLLAAVRERFDRAWDCPRCGSDLRVLRRGGLIAGCESYPDCEASFSIPVGTVVETCPCGLPVFETARTTRCLDANCERWTEAEG